MIWWVLWGVIWLAVIGFVLLSLAFAGWVLWLGWRCLPASTRAPILLWSSDRVWALSNASLDAGLWAAEKFNHMAWVLHRKGHEQ